MNELDAGLKKAKRTDVAKAAAFASQEFRSAVNMSDALDIAYATIELPLGTATVAATRRGLIRVAYDNLGSRDEVLADLCAHVSPRMLEIPDRFDALETELDEYFAGRRTKFDLPIDWSLTGGFTRKVLKRTARIPYGRTSTYGQIAAAVGSPKAARAAGNALGSNPIPIVVPCHRVLHAGGGLGGYTGGLEYKRLLLETEGALGG